MQHCNCMNCFKKGMPVCSFLCFGDELQDTGGNNEVDMLEGQFSGQLWIPPDRAQILNIWLFENEIRSSEFWPIIAGPCFMRPPRLKNREKKNNSAISVFIRTDLGRARDFWRQWPLRRGQLSRLTGALAGLSSKVEGNAVLEARSGCLIVIYREEPPGGEAPLLSSEPTVL